IEISKKIPDKVWLTSIIKDFNTLRLTGYALSDFDLATFQKGLETAHLFEKVELISSITVYLLKQFAYDSLSKNLIMSISESKDQGRFASLIQNKAKDVGLNVIKSAPPSGILELEENQLNQTKLGWTQTSKQSPSGMYIWSKNEMLEAKSFILEATINFKKIINSRKENES
ncbi:MAG: PilN domain-containing protein, partial [Deltaproteobacteria bacterium]|nr:PilN domain-containing protein [Deltaproteobacteria bacterium]